IPHIRYYSLDKIPFIIASDCEAMALLVQQNASDQPSYFVLTRSSFQRAADGRTLPRLHAATHATSAAAAIGGQQVAWAQLSNHFFNVELHAHGVVLVDMHLGLLERGEF